MSLWPHTENQNVCQAREDEEIQALLPLWMKYMTDCEPKNLHRMKDDFDNGL
jgi:hypothetical protein